jgi:flagellar hook-associated protein 3 FlgL
MRISTSTIYDSGVRAMQQQTETLLQTQQQIASGRRILTPADDPVGAARVLDVSQSQSINAQYGINTGTAGDSLGLEESILGNVTGLLQNVRDLAVSAGNPILNQSDRANLANALRGSFQDLLGMANSTDGGGQYLFSGYQGGKRPFSETAPGQVAYSGDQGQRLIQISPSRQIAISDAGADVFGTGTNKDVFKTINDLADLLQNSSGAALTDGLSGLQLNLDSALQNISAVRASTGSRMNELDSAKSAGDDRALQYSQTLSRLQDLDYAKAASDLTQQQMTLEAAQKSFVKVAGLSLFDYL